MQLSLCVLLLGLFTLNAQAALYRFVDDAGRVQYSDHPPQKANKVEILKVAPPPAPDDSLPYATRRAMQNFPVTLYTGEACDPCQQAAEFLRARGVPFTEKRLTTREEIEAFRKENGSLDIPTLTIGKTRLKRFARDVWDEELDIAGYPKSTPYRSRSAP